MTLGGRLAEQQPLKRNAERRGEGLDVVEGERRLASQAIRNICLVMSEGISEYSLADPLCGHFGPDVPYHLLIESRGGFCERHAR